MLLCENVNNSIATFHIYILIAVIYSQLATNCTLSNLAVIAKYSVIASS